MNFNLEERSNYNKHDLITNKDYFNEFEDILTCHICQGFQIDPLSCSKCHNSFCSECQQTWHRNNLGNFSCIFRCSNNTFIKDLKPVLKILERLVIKCFRCSTEVKYADLTNHVERTCGKKIVTCRNNGCGNVMTRESLEDHNLTCEYMMVNCEECGKNILRKDQNNKIRRELAYEDVNDMFLHIDLEIEQTYHIAIFKLIKNKMGKTGNLFDSDQLKFIFDKLLEFHSKKIDENYEDSLSDILESTLLKNPLIFRKKDENLSEQLVNKFLNVYSMDSLSDHDMPKALRFLRILWSSLCEYVFSSSEVVARVVEFSLKFLNHNNPKVRECSATILGEVGYTYQDEYPDLLLADILNSLSNALNYKDDGQDTEQWESSRDRIIWAIGTITNNFYTQSIWISKWLSYFDLESGIKQEYSYMALCDFITCDPQLLYGENNENFPSIIKILMKVYDDQDFKLLEQCSVNIINSFFDKIKNDSTLIQYVKIAKANSEGRILEKLNKYFP